MTYRVVQWATGNLGRPAIEGIVSIAEGTSPKAIERKLLSFIPDDSP